VALMRARRRPREEVGYRDLLADLGRPGCPVCHGSHRAAWRYLDALLWEFVNDPGVRAHLRGTHGFCREHAQMAVALAAGQGEGLGMAILYEDLLRNAQRAAGLAVEAGGRRRTWWRRRERGDVLAASTPCPACESAARVADNYLRILARAAPDSEPGGLVRQPGRGLCLPHLAAGLGRAGTLEERERLVHCFEHGATDLRAELREYLRKSDYRFRHEGFTPGEASAWRRAVHRLVGEPAPRKPPER